jgi:hypothetical protein
MRRLSFVLLACLIASPAANAAVINFDTNPLIGNPALTTPGRQVVGGEPSLTFDIATDVIVFDSAQFGVTNPLSFFNGLVADLPPGGADVIVVQDTGTPFLAGIAADLIAAQVTTSGAGFFMYFNTNLQLARLVYSTDLGDAESDLAVLARFTNIAGPEGFATFPTVTADNFAVSEAVPEPATLTLLAAAAMGILRRRRHVQGR